MSRPGSSSASLKVLPDYDQAETEEEELKAVFRELLAKIES